MKHYEVSVAFQTCLIAPPMACCFVVGVYYQSVQSFQAGEERRYFRLPEQILPPTRTFMWLEQGVWMS